MRVNYKNYYRSTIQIRRSEMAEQKVFESKQDPQWINKTRTLIVGSKGMTKNQRHFMLSLFALMPHSKKEVTLEKHDVRQQIADLCEVHKTRYFMYFEVKKKFHFSLWLGRYPDGPSVKLDLEGLVLNKDIKFQGNSVKGARHILSFDKGLESSSKMKLVKQLFTGAFNVPKMHPKSTAVIDHVLNFTTEGSSISFKNYQVFREAINKDKDKIELYETGPRFMMDINVILDGVMGGEVLYRAPVLKNVFKKSKTGKRKTKPENIPELDMFGEEMEMEEQM